MDAATAAGEEPVISVESDTDDNMPKAVAQTRLKEAGTGAESTSPTTPPAATTTTPAVLPCSEQ